MNYETHIQPEQAEKSSKIRIPRENEDCWRPQGDPKTSQHRQKTPRRLKKRCEYLRLKNESEKLVGKFICIEKKPSSYFGFGITASKRYGNSPERNRFKRIVREAVRLSITLLPSQFEINVIPRKFAKMATMKEIQKELLELC